MVKGIRHGADHVVIDVLWAAEAQLNGLLYSSRVQQPPLARSHVTGPYPLFEQGEESPPRVLPFTRNEVFELRP
jgi:hypothetical protein